MTIWLDVTDLKSWPHPLLTGIQRTVANVLGELSALREDVRLFAYDFLSGELVEVEPADLPVIVRRHFPAVDRERAGGRMPASAVSAPIAPSGAAPVPAPPHVPQRPRASLRAWLKRTAFALLGRFKDDAIRQALTTILVGSKGLAVAVYQRHARRRRGTSGPGAEVSGMAPPIAKTSVDLLEERIPSRLLFKPGDVCISLSATWGILGYQNAIAHNKQNGSVACINMIYDLIPTLFPQWVSPGVSRLVTMWAHGQIKNADHILTISQFQSSEISRYIADEHLPRRPISVVRLGDNPECLNAINKTSPSRPRYVPQKAFVICVATLDIRKNHHCLYHVWRRLAVDLGDACPMLVLVGIPHEFVKDLLYQIHHDRMVNRVIVHLQDITDDELAWYYKNCLFTIYPSSYEGWGLPVAESLAIGKYCIAAGATSVPEVGGDLVDYFDPIDYPACYRLVRRAVTEPDYVRQREAQIASQYKPSTWRMTAEQILDVVDQLMVSVPRSSEQATGGDAPRAGDDGGSAHGLATADVHPAPQAASVA